MCGCTGSCLSDAIFPQGVGFCVVALLMFGTSWYLYVSTEGDWIAYVIFACAILVLYAGVMLAKIPEADEYEYEGRFAFVFKRSGPRLPATRPKTSPPPSRSSL